ncbi:MAG: polyprenyl diphosphate synthase [bacterium]|nr:polyprenyl diphosphate synthase [bacterium]
MNELNHVAIIVDGNGRWATRKGLTRSAGHLKGSRTLEKLILHVNKNTNIKYLSLYVFSTENFKRSKDEVDYLMNLFVKMFTRVNKKYKDENIKIIFSGRREGLSLEVLSSMNCLIEDTCDNTGLVVNFCLNYGGRSEIVDATKKIGVRLLNGEISIDDINEKLVSDSLYNKLPDVDFLIRTSGEMRISNFLLFQISYAEFYFTSTLFPDFTPSKFSKVIDEYYKRNRRFGGTNFVNVSSKNKI